MNEIPIYFHFEDVDFNIEKQSEKQIWLSESILAEEKEIGEINCILCSDEYLFKMNNEYLNHNTYTDIITFNYVEGKTISGDLFISIDRVKENASNFEVSNDSELNRVLIHGVLHLIGYNDKSPEEASTIRQKEDFYLTLYS